MLQLFYGQWELEQWKVRVWHLVQAPGKVSEISKCTGPGRCLVMVQSSQPQQEDLLALVCGEAARWG